MRPHERWQISGKLLKPTNAIWCPRCLRRGRTTSLPASRCDLITVGFRAISIRIVILTTRHTFSSRAYS